MRVVFMGTPDFAVPSLRALADSHDLVAVYTRPDAASGRGSARRPTPAKQAAAELGIPVLQPASLRDPDVQSELAAFKPDVIVVAAYGVILPPEVLAIPRLGAVNVHASLLPRWRGAAPVQASILAGDEFTGVAIMRMEEGLDTGPFCATAEVAVDGHDAESLSAALAEKGATLLLPALAALEDGTCAWMPQDDSAATYAPRIAKADVSLAPDLDVATALRRVRASSGQAPSRARVAARDLRILEAWPSEAELAPGAAAESKQGLLLGFADGALLVTRVRPEGRADMEASAWLCGTRLPQDALWEPLG